MRHVFVGLGLGILLALPAQADDIDRINQLTQPQFRQLSEDLGAAFSYKAVAPAEPLGTTGFDLGVEVSATRLENPDVLELATSGDVPSTLYLPKLHVHKGLPFGLDIGAFYAGASNTDANLVGAELRYALIEGSTATPALGLRGTYTKLSGIDQLDMSTTGVELSVSKGFAMLTPYAGIGRVWVDAAPKNVASLNAEDFGLSKYYVGTNINFALLNIALEADRTGDATTYSAKLGWRF